MIPQHLHIDFLASFWILDRQFQDYYINISLIAIFRLVLNWSHFRLGTACISDRFFDPSGLSDLSFLCLSMLLLSLIVYFHCIVPYLLCLLVRLLDGFLSQVPFSFLLLIVFDLSSREGERFQALLVQHTVALQFPPLVILSPFSRLHSPVSLHFHDPDRKSVV